MSDTRFFLPFEDLHYSFSLFTDHTDDDDRLSARLRYFADFLENLVLSDRLIIEENDSGEFIWADQEVIEICDSFRLSSQFEFRKMEGVSAGEHSPNVFGPFLQAIGQAGNLSDLNVAEILSQDDLFQHFDHLTQHHSFATLHDKNFREIYDYIQFLTAKYGMLKEGGWEAIAKTTKAFEQLKTSYDERHLRAYLDAALNIFDYGIEPKLFGLPDNIATLNARGEINISKVINNEKLKALVSKERIQDFEEWVLLIFYGFSDSALSMVLREGLVWNPSPLRANLLLNTPVFARTDKQLLKTLDSAAMHRVAEHFDQIHERYTRFIQFPLLFNYIITQANSVKDIFDIALNLKASKELRRYKTWCSELDNCLQEGMLKDANKLISDANQFISRITSPKISESKFSLQISFPPAVSFETPIGMPDFRKNHLIFLKDVYEGASTPKALEEKAKKLFRRV
ncbi:MAG: hypothetical protein KDC70_15760 [Saprospiraceae bacterium]|nr:hypothetical protein [Saprospiraceae bacterium]